MTINQYTGKPAHRYFSGEVNVPASADLLFRMSVSVHIHFFKPLVRRFCVQRKRYFFKTVSFLVLVAACGSKWQGVASFPAHFQGIKCPTFAPKRQGNTPDAHTAPRFRPSFGQPKGIGRPIPLWVVITGLFPIRPGRILVSWVTQQGVL